MRTVNLLFKAYFRLNTLRLCKNISRPVEAKGLDKVVPLGGKVEILTYNYYTGRVAMFEDDYGRAEENLVKAYKGCKGGKGGEGNMRRCLGYLIPVRMVRGCLPTQVRRKKGREMGELLETLQTSARIYYLHVPPLRRTPLHPPPPQHPTHRPSLKSTV
jgi:hypothetical protein